MHPVTPVSQAYQPFSAFRDPDHQNGEGTLTVNVSFYSFLLFNYWNNNYKKYPFAYSSVKMAFEEKLSKIH